MSEVCKGCGCEIDSGLDVTFGDRVCRVCAYKIFEFEKFDPGISTRPFSAEAACCSLYTRLGFRWASDFYRSPEWEILVDEWLEKGMP